MPRRRISVTARRPSLFCVHFLRMGAGQCRKTARGEKFPSLLPKTPGRPGSGGPAGPAKRPIAAPTLGPGSLGALHAPRLRGARFVFVSFFFVLFFLSCRGLFCLVLPFPDPLRRPGWESGRIDGRAMRGGEGRGKNRSGAIECASPRSAGAERLRPRARCFGAPRRPLRPRRAWRSKAARQGSLRGRKPRRPAPCPQPPSGSQARMALRLWHKRWGGQKPKAADSRQARRASARSARACRGLQAGSRGASRRRRASTGMSQRQMPKRGSAQTPRR